MSVRTPIQVPEELKNQVEGLREGFHAKTNYEVIEKLIKHYQASVRQKEIDRQEREKEKQRREAEDLFLGSELKQQFTQYQEKVGLKSPGSAMKLLLEHFEKSDKIDKETFYLYQQLK